MKETETYYHGSGMLFDSFDLSHALEGDGKVKFGYGVYVTSQYGSAAHYSASNDKWIEHYVYTLKVPEKRVDNYIAFKQPVHPEIVRRTTERLGCAVPEKCVTDGKEFRKYLAARFAKELSKTIGVKDAQLKLAGEKSASEFLLSIDVDFIEWPYSWINPDKGCNRAILDDKAVIITKVDKITLDDKKQLVKGSEIQIR